MPELVFYRRGEELMRIGLDRNRLTLGRGSQNDISIPDESVSRQQAALERRGDRVFLLDLSGAGTQVAGKSETEVPLDDGIDISLGQLRAVFRASGDGGGTASTVERPGTAVIPLSEQEHKPLPIRLRVRSASDERSLPFVGDEVTLGSDRKNRVLLEDRFTSAFHAKITRSGPNFLVKDLGSTNGTFLNGLRLYEAEVSLGATLRMGSSDITLERGGPESNKAAAPQAFSGIVGSDSGMRRIYELIERVAPSTAAVAVFGESGTGKELVARALHDRSARASKPFIPLNCAAISKELVESELFGHEKGAFTGAANTRLGAFEEADGGTLFLDEIGELPSSSQAKLLRALELGEVKRVGATKPSYVDVRIVAATNRDLLAAVRAGRFREDLYYRLCVVPLHLPPLRQRKGDILMLAEHFLALFAPKGAMPKLGDAAREKLAAHAWPGNVRELKNAIHRALLLRKGPNIEAQDLSFGTGAGGLAPEPSVTAGLAGDDAETLYLPGKTMEQIELETIAKALKRNGGNRAKTVEELKVSRSTLFKRIRENNIDGGPSSDEELETAEA